ncbi:hypothetical protein BJ875DRAFT_391723 [Amylocarpus encephaloides]|uniref:DM2 domain-containing protein n=1 Tax=Amylocarpus encephaloides TaxID=45428 RepID=A0A9P8CA41_9HELO|nr:hypothetical protein BJ875DRAFT_391723 [Amylocarpus encephaloides]
MQQQPQYRGYPQRSPHAAPQSNNARRGIGPMVGQHPQNMTQSQMQAQQNALVAATTRAKMRSAKPTDMNMAEGVEDCIIGDGVQRYRDLRDLERRLDSTMMRKRLDLQDSVNRNVKRYRTMRIWITNTAEDQPWQADTLDVDAFDFSTNMDPSYRVKIVGKLLDEDEEDISSDDSDDEDDDHNGDAMDEDAKGKKKTTIKPPNYKLSNFFKAMTVEFDRNRMKDGSDQSVEWKKPAVPANAQDLPNAADFDQLEFKRGGDENINITINLTRDETPERFELSPVLADILDTKVATRAEAVMGIWEYIKAEGLQEDDEKRAFECDERLRQIVHSERGFIPRLQDQITHHMTPLPPVELPYTIRVDKEFHAAGHEPQPTIYDVQVQVDDPLRAALMSYLTNESYTQNLLEIARQNEHGALLIQTIGNSKSKQAFFDALSKNPTEFIAKWISSQKRDLEVIAGEATRGGGEDATGDEWRRGGKEGIWGSDNVKESVNLMVGQKPRV